MPTFLYVTDDIAGSFINLDHIKMMVLEPSEQKWQIRVVFEASVTINYIKNTKGEAVAMMQTIREGLRAGGFLV